ncbi:MAG TPA: hypothetical protein VJR58_18500, partial [Vineibacter sp.]|nr:hypothetical protein [Vineibacter sp.]
MTRRQQYTLAMQIVLGKAMADDAGLGQDLSQLTARQARPNDRAMQVPGQLPDLGAPLQRLRHHLGRPGNQDRRQRRQLQDMPMPTGMSSRAEPKGIEGSSRL